MDSPACALCGATSDLIPNPLDVSGLGYVCGKVCTSGQPRDEVALLRRQLAAADEVITAHTEVAAQRARERDEAEARADALADAWGVIKEGDVHAPGCSLVCSSLGSAGGYVIVVPCDCGRHVRNTAARTALDAAHDARQA